jgi:UDP-2,4-diacetamido-2,4,6-trideoxy-beta-L-altropyranose hydrolase
VTTSLRKIVIDDAETLFAWQRNTDIRRHFHVPQIPSWDDHLTWLKGKLADRDALLWLIMDGEHPGGTLRLDRESPGVFDVSILVEPARQGRGLGLAALALARAEKPAALLRAEVLDDNDASHALFQKAGYVLGAGRYLQRPGTVAIIRADGGPGVGLGHVRRCFALGSALKTRGFEVVVLADCAAIEALAATAGLAATSCGADETAIMDKAEGAAVLVLDHYHLDMSLLSAPILLAFDDTEQRPTPADVVVNGSPAASSIVYASLGARKVLAGPAYQVIRTDLKRPDDRDPSALPRRVLVTIGGGDPRSMLPVLARWLGGSRFADMQTDLVVGPYAEVPQVPDGVTLHKDPANMAELIAQADIAVSAAGQTLMELLYCGVPTAALCLAENQEPNLKALEEEGAVLAAGNADDPDWFETLDVAMNKLLTDPALRIGLSTKARQLVDGKGAQRIADAIV